MRACRIAVAAGPVANFILAILVFAGVYYSFGEYVTPAKVDRVIEGGAAEAAGFESISVVEHVVVPAGHAARYPYADGGRMPLNYVVAVKE